VVRDENANNQLEDNLPFAVNEESLVIIMNELDREVMKMFTSQISSTAEEATRMSGIDKIFPNVKIGYQLFNPCEYSMNGILDNGECVLIHFTPEPR
jgi:S-adenosylmethionine decarboxylase